jgi:hypothetical protein
MAEPTGYAMKELFSQLVGRDVAFAQPKPASRANGPQMYGLYTVLPQETALVVQADLALLGSFAGALVGLQDDAVKERLGAKPLEELLRDAIHEVLNIASTVVTTEGRAVFKKMAADPVYFDTLDGGFLQKPDRKTSFDVSIDSYQGGFMTIYAQL